MVSNLLFFTDGLLPIVGLETISNSITLESILVLASCFFGAWFASKYLNIREIFPKLQWVAIPVFILSGLAVLLSYLSGIVFIASIANMLSFSVAGIYFLAGVYLFSKKTYPKFYVIAYSIPLLFAADYFVFRNIGLEFLATQPSHLKAAVIVEMLLLTYAIVFRMRAVKEENDLRQTELRIFLKRQEVMNRKNAQQLLEEVYLENLTMHYDLDGFEIKLLQYISEGKENSKIARKLKTTEAEIEALTKELYHKLEISDHIQEDYRMVDAQADYIYN
jgi:DNA-binding CsgD family transcriptional regulator